jgi:hypothetical protein
VSPLKNLRLGAACAAIAGYAVAKRLLARRVA